jgi:hypothetical protein
MSNEPVAKIRQGMLGLPILDFIKPFRYESHSTHNADIPLYTHPSQEWISVKDRLPDDQQAVAFVVKDRSDSYLNGMVLGGKYIGGAMPCFSVPGMGCMASHWMPLPDAPILKKASN